jgi:hypothetical protein
MAMSAMPASGDKSAESVNLAHVLEQEAIEIRKHGLAEPGEKPDRFGVCFSGGGIRSACVALGVSQSLARHGLFRKVQYISAISGGGYMLGALTAWIKRTDGGFSMVDRALALSADPAIPLPDATSAATGKAYPRFLEPDFIRNLRSYSSYLTPRLGMLSGDSLALVSIYLRNLLLNLTMMFSAVFALMLLAQTVAPQRLWHKPLPEFSVVIFIIAITICFVFAVFAVGKEIQSIRNATGPGSAGRTRRAFFLGFAGCALLWIVTPTFYTYPHGILIALLFAAGLAIAGICLTWFGFTDSRVKPVQPVTIPVLALAWFTAAGLVDGIAVVFFHHLAFPGIVFVGGGYVIFGLPLILCSFPLVSYLFIGVLGNQLPDAEREWLARFAGYFLSGAACVGIVIAIAIDGPAWIDWLICAISSGGWKGASAALLPGGWLYVTLSGVLLGRSSSTGDKKPTYNFKNFIVAVAPFVFILGVLVQVSWTANTLLVRSGTISSLVSAPAALRKSWPSATTMKISAAPCCQPCRPSDYATTSINACVFERQKPAPRYPTQFILAPAKTYDPFLWYFGFLAGFAALSGLLAWRLDINEFSMHLFYRNRLVRAFPGASKLERSANIFTNFSLTDDFPLRSLVIAPTDKGVNDKDIERSYDGPYPIWGTALNITHGEDLSWQQRKAASFIYSPLFCGWDYTADNNVPVDLIRLESPDTNIDKGTVAPYGFRSTTTYGGEGGTPVIGTAMAASGAAASPNMGYHTRAGVAALLALFNVRLGWWTGNPRNNNTFREYAPGAGYLLKELFGSTDATSRYVYLSDGGHFENLGLYELIRRRVRFIIVSDAGCDGDYTFSDLGNAIEHCRRDFGVHIDLRAADDIHAVLHDYLPTGDQRLFRQQHYAIGTIGYPRLPDEAVATIGYILYIKSSLTGDEPADVLAMRADYPSFPHDSTGNQFFNESLFESYRALGEHMVTSALSDISEKVQDNSLSETKKALYSHFKLLIQ